MSQADVSGTDDAQPALCDRVIVIWWCRERRFLRVVGPPLWAEEGESLGVSSGTGLPIPASAGRRQIRRAWAFLSLAFLAFFLTCAGFGGAGYWYRGHATIKRAVRVEVVQGDRAFIRPAYQRNWTALPSQGAVGAQMIELQEGDALQTLGGTQVLLTFWDNSLVQVFEGTEVQLLELRATRYSSGSSAITMRQMRGLSSVAVAPGDYRRSRFQVLADDTTIVMREGDGGAGGGVFIVQLVASEIGSGDGVATVRASVRRGAGAVRVAGYPDELRLAANEQTIVAHGGPAGSPTPARRDFVANGRFEPSGATGCEPKGPFTPWLGSCTPGQNTSSFGKLSTVTDTLGGQQLPTLEIARSVSSTDPANTGLRQMLDVGVADQPSLLLTADLKVLEQTVPGGGQLGSEFPIIVRITYYDASGGFNTRIWGFYSLPAANGAIPFNPSLVEVRLVTPGEWVPLSVDLRGLAPQPVRLESLEVYGSGQGYRSRITNVAIIGEE